MANSFGSLRNLDARLHAKFDAPHLALDDIERAMDEFAAAAAAGTAREAGWPDWINVQSKIGQVARYACRRGPGKTNSTGAASL